MLFDENVQSCLDIPLLNAIHHALRTRIERTWLGQNEDHTILVKEMCDAVILYCLLICPVRIIQIKDDQCLRIQ